ncbi:ethanolamine utilization protein [Cetobacterium sp. SF1]|uniref:ethanolamine utilization protein n=1 Tax=unclassified Cetobacterium TaxID=2630983 RepID=UPI003CEE01FF
MVFTEEKLKSLYKKESFTEFFMEEGDILTPSGRQFLEDKKILLRKDKKEVKEVQTPEKEEKLLWKYKGENGEVYLEKPEHMTQIYGNVLVNKNSKRIILRGKIDSFLSRWLLLQNEFSQMKNNKLNFDMETITILLKKIVIGEVLNEPLEDVTILGESLDKIKEISHNPKKYFGREHLFDISSANPFLVLKLNEMRALSRELELYAIDAFYRDNGKIERTDLVEIFNRLSSGIYVMMLKGEKNEYGIR